MSGGPYGKLFTEAVKSLDKIGLDM